MCIYMCVEVVLINILASHLAPQTKIHGSALGFNFTCPTFKLNNNNNNNKKGQSGLVCVK